MSAGLFVILPSLGGVMTPSAGVDGLPGTGFAPGAVGTGFKGTAGGVGMGAGGITGTIGVITVGNASSGGFCASPNPPKIAKRVK